MIPSAFGESPESIEETFSKYNQNALSNFEGKAREEVLERVISRNHIRIRKNRQRDRQDWSIQLYELTSERREAVVRWAKFISMFQIDKVADLTIHQFIDDSKIKTSLRNLIEEAQDMAVVLTEDMAETKAFDPLLIISVTKKIDPLIVVKQGGCPRRFPWKCR